MIILADENVENRVVAMLRDAGYAVRYIAEFASGTEDENVLSEAVDAIELLLTADKDFGELHFHQGLIHQGVLLYRLPKLTTVEKGELILKTLRAYETELAGSFSVLAPGKIRIRKR